MHASGNKYTIHKTQRWGCGGGKVSVYNLIMRKCWKGLWQNNGSKVTPTVSSECRGLLLCWADLVPVVEGVVVGGVLVAAPPPGGVPRPQLPRYVEIIVELPRAPAPAPRHAVRVQVTSVRFAPSPEENIFYNVKYFLILHKMYFLGCKIFLLIAQIFLPIYWEKFVSSPAI